MSFSVFFFFEKLMSISLNMNLAVYLLLAPTYNYLTAHVPNCHNGGACLHTEPTKLDRIGSWLKLRSSFMWSLLGSRSVYAYSEPTKLDRIASWLKLKALCGVCWVVDQLHSWLQ